MPTITQTSNENAIWDGTVPFDASADVTGFNLHVAQGVDRFEHYKLVKFIAKGAGPGPVALGPLTYAQLFLPIPHRTFFLKATTVFTTGKETELEAEPSLSVAPSSIPGWSLGQLMEQDMRPVVLVGLDPSTGQYHPLTVIPDGVNGGFKLSN